MEHYEDGMTAPRHYVESGDMVRYDAPHEFGTKMNRYANRAGESPWMVVAEIFGGMGRHGGEMSRYRGQPRNAMGQYKRMRFAETFEDDKERIAGMLAEECEPEELAEKIVKEASEVITAASSEKIYDMFKEFAELAIVMCAFAEHLPEEMVNAAGEEALEYWNRKLEHSARRGYQHSGAMRYSDDSGNYSEEMRRMYRSRRDDDYDNPLMMHGRRGYRRY